MKIVTVANVKGGTGKTTIALNLVVAAMRDDLKTLLVNSDVQLSATDIVRVRAEKNISPPIHATDMPTDRLHVDLKKKYDGYDMAVIDAGGRDSRSFRSAIVAADVLIIPILPSGVDYWASIDTIRIAREVQAEKLKIAKEPIAIFCLLNQQVRYSVMAAEILESLEKIDAPMLKTILYFRQAYRRSTSDGRSVLEWTDRQAAREIESLWEEVCVWL